MMASQQTARRQSTVVVSRNHVVPGTVTEKLFILLLLASPTISFKTIVFMEGAQGSGKTHLSYELPQFIEIDNVRHNIVIVPEPYEKWQTSGAITTFKEDIRKYNADFQHYIMVSLVRREFLQYWLFNLLLYLPI